jgi:hypothetical protein
MNDQGVLMAAKKKNKKKTLKKGIKKTAKKRAALKKKQPKKNVRAQAKKSRKPAAKKKPARKPTRKKAAPSRPGSLTLHVTPALFERLETLAVSMAIPLDQILTQALGEFADTWEDHARTVAALDTGDDRMQLVVPQNDPLDD